MIVQKDTKTNLEQTKHCTSCKPQWDNNRILWKHNENKFYGWKWINSLKGKWWNEHKKKQKTDNTILIKIWIKRKYLLRKRTGPDRFTGRN